MEEGEVTHVTFVKAGFIGGLAAAATVIAAGSLAAIGLGVPTSPELVWDAAVSAMPGPLFSLAIDRLKYAGKPLLFAGLIALELLIGGVLGVIYALAVRGDSRPGRLARRRPWLTGVVYGGVLWAILLTAGAQLLRSKGLTAWAVSLASLMALAILQSELLARSGHLSSPPAPAGVAYLLRRDLLVKAMVALAAVAVGSTGFWAIFRDRRGQTSVLSSLTSAPVSSGGQSGAVPTSPISKMYSYITPNVDFYAVSKNFRDPVVDVGSWHLEIKGLVSHPLRLTLAELKSLPSVTRIITLECISNEVGGDLMGNAAWKGVLLADLLERAGVSPEAKDVVLRAADDYSDSIPVERALSPTTILAYEMNGESLSPIHGFPVRLLVPGIYGMKNVKWITSIEFAAGDYYGFWQQQGWSDEAVIRTMSRVDTPSYGEITGHQATIGGVAFAGDRGISKVEVSFDEVTWQEAALPKPESQLSWVLWTLDATIPGEGRQRITVRAVDGQGTPQTEAREDPFPSGATGYHHQVLR